MRVQLRSFELDIPSIASLDLGNKDRLLDLWARVRDLHTVSGVRFFGTTDHLKSISNVEQIAKALAKGKVETYSFSDVKDIDAPGAKTVWTIDLRKRLAAVRVLVEATPPEADMLADELTALNRVLLGRIGQRVVSPFSFVEVPDLRFRPTRPPRSFGRISNNSVVDMIYLKAALRPEEARVVDQLRSKATQQGDCMVVKWGDPAVESVQQILERRYAWYAEHAGFPVDSSFNALGDKEFALWGAARTSELTFYSSFNHSGAKALVGDSADLETAKQIEDLGRLLASGKIAEGSPLERLTLVVPSRESALDLQPLAARHGMPIVYVGEGNRMWDPFPPEYE